MDRNFGLGNEGAKIQESFSFFPSFVPSFIPSSLLPSYFPALHSDLLFLSSFFLLLSSSLFPYFPMNSQWSVVFKAEMLKMQVEQLCLHAILYNVFSFSTDRFFGKEGRGNVMFRLDWIFVRVPQLVVFQSCPILFWVS